MHVTCSNAIQYRWHEGCECEPELLNERQVQLYVGIERKGGKRWLAEIQRQKENKNATRCTSRFRARYPPYFSLLFLLAVSSVKSGVNHPARFIYNIYIYIFLLFLFNSKKLYNFQGTKIAPSIIFLRSSFLLLCVSSFLERKA